MKKSAIAFGKEVKNFAGRFADFLRCHKAMAAILMVFLLFLYGVRIFYYDISFDSEIAISNQGAILMSWLAINRFGLVATKKIFGLVRFVPYVSNFLLLLTLGFTALFLSFCVEEWRGKSDRNKWFCYIFPAAYISAPCLAEQFCFSLQSFEIAWAGLLCAVAVYSFSRLVFYRESIFWAVPGFICMVWAFGSYQAFAGMFITLILISFIFHYQNGSFSISGRHGWLVSGVCFVVIFCIGFIGYLAAAKLIRFYYHVDSAYIDNMFRWKTLGIQRGLENVRMDVERIYFASWPTFFQKSFLPTMIIFIFFSLRRGWRKKQGEYWVYLIALGLLLLSPIYLTLVSGEPQPIRGQLVYPLVAALFLAEITTVSRRWLSGILCVAAAFITLRHGHIMTQLFHTAYMVYEQDKEFAGAVYGRISQTEADNGLSECPVVFVGRHGIVLPGDAIRGDVIGFSFFEWDNGGYAGSTGRILNLCNTLGYPMRMPDEGQAAMAAEYAKTMPSWPATDSVQVKDQIIVIKLSDS
ncbi:MAG: hypothetical protein HFI68_07805 [Lachnospiraceae bacterium]|nr:hypothetical protein [Lachnospiraceae bacterium]